MLTRQEWIVPIAIVLGVLADVVLILWLRAHRRSAGGAQQVIALGAYSPILTWMKYRLAPVLRSTPARARNWVNLAMSPLLGSEPATEPEAAPERVPFPSLWRYLRIEIWGDDARSMRLFLALACLGISIFLGIAYSGNVTVVGWQLWTWLVCTVGIVIALLPPGPRPVPRPLPWGWLLALLLAALLLRATRLETIPGALHVDEAGIAEFAMRSVFTAPNDTFNPFRTGPSSQPALYHYLVRASIELVGYSITGLRFSSALAGTLAVLATYAVVAVLDNRRTALLAAILMTAYHYHIHWSRLALNNIWDTLWVPLILACYVWGWKRRWSGGAVLSGVALGLAQYFYAGNKVAILLLAFAMISLWRKDQDGRRLLVHGGKLLLTAACVAAPLVLFIIQDPQPYFARSWEVFGWHSNAIQVGTGGTGNLWAYFWRQVWHTLGAFTAYPDDTGFYGAVVPLVFGLAAPLFIAGFLWAVRKRMYIPALWIALTTFFGGFMLAGGPSSSHYAVSMPAICWLIATPLDWLFKTRRWRLALLLLVAVVGIDLWFYFGRYVSSSPRDLILPLPTLVPPP
jgi:4-amino-4-deoxy-L-arabinose transferase-like glycosyltransferase